MFVLSARAFGSVPKTSADWSRPIEDGVSPASKPSVTPIDHRDSPIPISSSGRRGKPGPPSAMPTTSSPPQGPATSTGAAPKFSRGSGVARDSVTFAVSASAAAPAPADAAEDAAQIKARIEASGVDAVGASEEWTTTDDEREADEDADGISCSDTWHPDDLTVGDIEDLFNGYFLVSDPILAILRSHPPSLSSTVTVIHRHCFPPSLSSTVTVIHRHCHPPSLSSTVTVIHRHCHPPSLSSTVTVFHRHCHPPSLSSTVTVFAAYRTLSGKPPVAPLGTADHCSRIFQLHTAHVRAVCRAGLGWVVNAALLAPGVVGVGPAVIQ